MLGRIHSGKGDLGMRIDAREHIAFCSGNIPHDGIECYQKPGMWLFFQLGDALLRLVCRAFLAQCLGFLRMEIQPMFLDDPLDFP